MCPTASVDPDPDPHRTVGEMVSLTHGACSCRATRSRSTSQVDHEQVPFSLLISSVLLLPVALVVGAGPAAVEPPATTFGSHVSSCAQMSTGCGGQHNPSHHRGPTATDAMSGMHC